MLPISLTKSGLLNPRELSAWRSHLQQDIHKAVANGMNAAGKPVAAAVRAQVSAGLKIKHRGFLNSFKHKLFDKKPDRLPALLIGSKVPWSGLHEHGGAIQGPLLVPINVGHPGPIAWQNLIRSLFRMKAAFFKVVNGKTILFAKKWAIQDSNKKVMSKFRVRPGKTPDGRRISADDLMPIAVLMPKVQLKGRIKLDATVRANLSKIAGAIKAELDKI